MLKRVFGVRARERKPIVPARRIAALVALGALCLAGAGCETTPSQSEVPTFATPQEAIDALVDALRSSDKARLEAVLGSEGADMLSSGDEVADSNEAQAFLAAYDQRHDIVLDGDDVATLVVGRDDWPMPIPLVRGEDAWEFDTESGKEEILTRRIGRNELETILVCRAVVDAQQEFVELTRAAGTAEFARKFRSDPGQHNGLFWQTNAGEPPSPLGPLVAAAATEGYVEAAKAANESIPFHGYYFRLLDAQGQHAPGGKRSYISNGRMSGGFGLVAWPAAYGSTGIMTFIANQEGIVYQKDLGEQTKQPVAGVTSFDPGPGWNIVP